MENPQVIFSDEHLLIVYKPSGWITNEAETTKDRPTLQRWLKENFTYEISKNDALRSGIVHRLDKETSGILAVAKTKNAFENLQSQFKERKVEKKYLALVHGKVEMGEGEISLPVGRLPWRRDRFGVLPGGRDSITFYKVKGFYSHSGNTYTLVEASPKTGRTHQIRIHFKYLGHPLMADPFYAGRKTSKKDKIICPRLFLHAFYLAFNHPASGVRVEFESELPQELGECLKKLASE